MACLLLLLFSTANQPATASTMPDGVYIDGPTKKFFSMEYVFTNTDVVVDELNKVASLSNVYFYQANTVVTLEDAFQRQDFVAYVEGTIPSGNYIPENSTNPIVVGSGTTEKFTITSIE